MRERCDSGQATLELALLLPALVVILSVLVQVGLIGVDQVRVWHAAREGARVAAVTADANEIAAAVRRGGLDAASVDVTPSAAYRQQGAPVTVIVSLRPPWQTPIVGGFIGPDPIRARSSMRIEQP